MTVSADCTTPAHAAGDRRMASACALRFAWRELRGGLRGFGVFIACIALGVMAIAGVGSVAASLDRRACRDRPRHPRRRRRLFADPTRGERRRARVPRRPRHGLGRRDHARPWRATGDGRSALVEVKAVDAGYPLFGAVDDRSADAARRIARAARRRVRRAPPIRRC